MSNIQNIAICTWYDDAIAHYADIARDINIAWKNKVNDYYTSISNNNPEQTKYIFDVLTDNTEPTDEWKEKRKPHWNRIPMLSNHLNMKNDDGTNKYDYVMWIDADACFRYNNNYTDLFESIVTRYSGKDLIFSQDEDDYMIHRTVIFTSLFILSVIVLLYVFLPFNKFMFISLVTLFSLLVLVTLIMVIIKYNSDYDLNSGVIIIKNTDYSKRTIEYWKSSDCYNNRVKPWQDQGCLRYSMVRNINNIQNNSVILNYGILQMFEYNQEDESLIIHFAGDKQKHKRQELLLNLKNEFGIN